jgi:hypothetical protein
VSFHLPHGEWIELPRANGVDVEALLELRAAEGAGPDHSDVTTPEWARSRPNEEIWKAREREQRDDHREHAQSAGKIPYESTRARSAERSRRKRKARSAG